MKKIISVMFITMLAIALFNSCGFLFDAPYNPLWDYDYSQMKLVQLEPPGDNQTIVTVYTTHGSFTAMLFPEYAPNTVENFIARINDGFYEDKHIFAVKENEYFITGANNLEGSQGVTMDGKLIENEYSVNLWPFKGALMSVSGTQGYGDSRFFVAGSTEFNEEDAQALRDVTKPDGSKLIPETLVEALLNNDCVSHFSGVYTVFGQVIDGFDVLDKLLSVESEAETFRPVEDVFIEKIVIVN